MNTMKTEELRRLIGESHEVPLWNLLPKTKHRDDGLAFIEKYGDLYCPPKKNNAEIKMETKSRYEVIAELEEKKRALIQERDSFDDKIKVREKNIKNAKRQIEDMEEELTEFKSGIEDKKKTVSELITSVDDSLKRLGTLQSQKK